jgi:uncharacterized protein
MRNYSFLIKPASSLCNYRCTYCFYADVSEHREVQYAGIMDETTMRNLVKVAVEAPDATDLTFAFQGGEPTLAGLGYFKNFTQTVAALKLSHQTIHYALQTNGSNLDDAWCGFLKENGFLVGVSLDGYRANHDFFRVSAKKTGTYDEVMSAIKRLREHKVDFNILTVLTRVLAKQPKRLYEFYRTHSFSHVQLIPCLPGLDENEDPYALTPSAFATFYKTFFDLWYEDYIQGDYMSVTLFDNVIPMFAGIAPQQCGMLGFCSPQFVVEGDGTVYPCDFYVLDRYKIGNVNENSLPQIMKNEILDSFLREPKRMSPLCQDCAFKKICNGNCKRLNITYFDDGSCGYQDFLHYAYPRMRKIVDRKP